MATNAHAATVAAKTELGIIPSYKDAGISNKILKLSKDYNEAQALAKKFDAERREIAQEILVELAKAGLNAKEGAPIHVLVNGLKVSAIASHNSTISKEKLLEAQVPAETIVECTVESSYEYVLVTDVAKAQVARKEKKAGVKNIAAAKAKKSRR
jgi:hypothetical protein